MLIITITSIIVAALTNSMVINHGSIVFANGGCCTPPAPAV